ncbi:MAG: hypothetical protein AAF487_07690 [Bacteroidota bacterium]
MTASEFRQKRLLDRFGIVETKGIALAKRKHGSFNVELYSIDDFYVEIWKKVGLNIIHWIETVDKKNLEYYTDQINLDNLED